MRFAYNYDIQNWEVQYYYPLYILHFFSSKSGALGLNDRKHTGTQEDIEWIIIQSKHIIWDTFWPRVFPKSEYEINIFAKPVAYKTDEFLATHAD